MFATVVMIRGPPGEPITYANLPSFTTIVGVMAESGRLPGPIAFAGPWINPYAFGTPRFAAKSSISLFRRNPNPGTVTFEPNVSFNVVVTETAVPSGSTTE